MGLKKPNLKHELNDFTGSFNYSKWKKFVNSLNLHFSNNIDIISPFGFELTGDRSYLKGCIRRFYLYIGYNNKKFGKTYAWQLANILNHKLRIDFPIFSSYIKKIWTKKKTILGPGNLIEIRVYERKIQTPLLEDWATYQISIPYLVCNRTLPELLTFDTSKISRAYVFQLSVIANSIFKNGLLTQYDYYTVKKLANPHRYKNTELDMQKDISECIVTLNSTVIPQFTKIYKKSFSTTQKNNKLIITVQDYHSKKKLIYTIPEIFLLNHLQKIKHAFQSY